MASTTMNWLAKYFAYTECCSSRPERFLPGCLVVTGWYGAWYHSDKRRPEAAAASWLPLEARLQIHDWPRWSLVHMLSRVFQGRNHRNQSPEYHILAFQEMLGQRPNSLCWTWSRKLVRGGYTAVMVQNIFGHLPSYSPGCRAIIPRCLVSEVHLQYIDIVLIKRCCQ